MEQQKDSFSASFRLMGASLAMMWRLIWRGAKRTLRRVLFASAFASSWLLHHPWVVVALLASVIAMQQVKLMQAAARVNYGSYQLMVLQERLDSACMTNFKYSR